MNGRVHCVGVLVVDALCGPLPAYPERGGQTQVVADSIQFRPGGGAANSAAALAQLGSAAAIFSKVGDDPNGAFLLRELRQQGVETGGVVVAAGENSPFTFVGIHPGGDRTFVHVPGTNRTFGPADINEDELYRADILFYQDFWVLPQLDGQPAARLLEQARRRGLVTVLDECWGFGPQRESLELALPFVDYFLPSYDDLRALYRVGEPRELVTLLHDRGARNVVLKQGAQGCLVSTGRQCRAVPSCATRIVDTTGAGDCFDAGFIAGLGHGLDPFAAAVAGSRAAAACIAHVGGATGIPRFDQLMKEEHAQSG